MWAATGLCPALCLLCVVLLSASTFGVLQASAIRQNPWGRQRSRQKAANGTEYQPGITALELAGCKHERQVASSYPAHDRVLVGVDEVIPVLGITVVADPELLLLRLIYSLDAPIKHLILLYTDLTETLNNEIKHVMRHVEYVDVIRCPKPLGVAEAWNAVLRQYYEEEPWYMVVSYDVQFPRGTLRGLASTVWGEALNGSMEMGFLGWKNMHERDQTLGWEAVNPGAFNAFIMTQQCLRRIGFFDENIYPFYWEDTEYKLRGMAAEPPLRVRVYDQFQAVHGRYSHEGYTTGMTALGLSPNLSFTLPYPPRGNAASQRYVALKWGLMREEVKQQAGGRGRPTDRWRATFRTPFNVSGLPVGAWAINPAMRSYIVTGEGKERYESLPYVIPNASSSVASAGAPGGGAVGAQLAAG